MKHISQDICLVGKVRGFIDRIFNLDFIAALQVFRKIFDYVLTKPPNQSTILTNAVNTNVLFLGFKKST